ncbi:MAG TPA: hypothetical protein VJX70_13375 [Candidatus Acidoferrum sp.]|nr:hypothetical protein [Candidatus Acidoferrum sp.]
MQKVSGFTTVAGVGLLFAGVTFAQAPPGPITPPPSQTSSVDARPTPPPVQIPPRKNILGAWKLNRDESDDPKAKSNQRQVNNPNGNSGGMGGPRIGFPGGGMGGGGMGGPQHGNNGSQQSAEDRERYNQLVDPSIRLKLERKSDKDPTVEMFGDQGRKTIFYTDGHKPDAPAGVGVDVVEAKWDGAKLVSSSPLPKKGTMTRTYEVSSDGLQLWEEVELVIGKDKNPSRFRFVYDAVAKED